MSTRAPGLLMPSFLALALACVSAHAWGQDIAHDVVPAPGLDASHEVLYQDALQALAEGRKTDASNTLRRLIGQVPEHAGALIDLALIQCGLGNAGEAERLFATIETRFSPTREILELLNEARDSGCRPAAPTSAATVTIGRGIDNNVNQGASNSTFIVTGPDGTIELPLLEDFRPQRDSYTTLGTDYVRGIGANGSLGFLQVQQRRYDRLRAYDTGGLYAGVESPWRFGAWTLRTTGSVGTTTMGGRLYQKQMQLQARVAPPLPLPARTHLYLTGSATHTKYQSLRNFDSQVLEARALLTHQAGTLSTYATVGALSDRARGDRPGGNRHGNYATLSLRKTLRTDLSGELSWTRQQWDSAAPYSPELLIDQVRAQRTQVVRVALSWQLHKDHSIVLDARAVRNRENISIFQYDNRQLQLSWQWQVP